MSEFWFRVRLWFARCWLMRQCRRAADWSHQMEWKAVAKECDFFWELADHGHWPP